MGASGRKIRSRSRPVILSVNGLIPTGTSGRREDAPAVFLGGEIEQSNEMLAIVEVSRCLVHHLVTTGPRVNDLVRRDNRTRDLQSLKFPMRRVLFEPEECRAFAASCADQANCALDPKSQRVRVDLAQGWLDLAADIEAVEDGRSPLAEVH
jgi:hypothetical protein